MRKKEVKKEEEKERRVCPSPDKHNARSLEGNGNVFSQILHF
jgi:hypothetical protein